MPFDIGQSVNYLTDKLGQVPYIQTLSANPFLTSILISMIVVLGTLFVFRNTPTEESLLKMGFRVGVWTLLFSTGIIMLHNKILINESAAASKESVYGDVFTDNIFTTDEIIPVVPST